MNMVSDRQRQVPVHAVRQPAYGVADIPLEIVVLGLSLSSSWGNGHATTYRALLKALHQRGHNILFLERDVPWYATHRDLVNPPYARLAFYQDLTELRSRYAEDIRRADLVIVGSYVPDGVEVGNWVLQMARCVSAFYDIDTPVTFAKLQRGDYEYLSPRQIPRYDLYLSFAGGPILEAIERKYGSRMARPLYCAVDPELYCPEQQPMHWDLGYMGTYSADRQPGLEKLLIEVARQERERSLVVAGPNYPDIIQWPKNIKRIDHLPPARHRAFYNQQRYTLNLTRADMVKAGYSPSVRLFEAAACATPIISDYWPGLETFFAVGSDLLVARSTAEVRCYLDEINEEERQRIGQNGYQKVKNGHTAAHRAMELEDYFEKLTTVLD
jgi:spore maturation protein CgeB